MTNPAPFDNTIGYDEETGVRLAQGLSPEEEQQARQLYSIFNGLWGLAIIVGLPGSGKDLFGNILAYKIKRYFPWKRVLRDRMPYPLFGKYDGLFNPDVLKDELDKMNEISLEGGKRNKDKQLEKAADDWVAEKGQVLLKNSHLYLAEFWRYVYCREPMNPMNKTMGGINKEKRHIDVFITGTVQLESDLDKHTCLPFVDWRITASRSQTNPTGFVYYIEKVTYHPQKECLLPTSRAFPIAFDGGKPRSYLGDGKIVIKKDWYRGETDEEKLVLGAIKSGINIYEDLVRELEDQADMSEAETLTVLKELKFRKTKRVIDYPCFFGLWNSKNAPQSINPKGLASE